MGIYIVSVDTSRFLHFTSVYLLQRFYGFMVTKFWERSRVFRDGNTGYNNVAIECNFS